MLEMENWSIEKFIDYDLNPRKNDHAVEATATAIKEFGFRVPIVAKSDGSVVDGHLRLKAARRLGLTEIPVVLADDMTDAQISAFRLSVNKLAELADWDMGLLKDELSALDALDFDLSLIGFDLGELSDLFAEEQYPDGKPGSMAVNYGIPPFSVLDTRQGPWVRRKREWRDLIGDAGESRENILGSLHQLGDLNNGVSLLDPVLAEIITSWFGTSGGVVVDPFAGDTVFGFVSGSLGMDFHGIELRQEQVDLNQARCDLAGLPCRYYCDTSENIDAHISDEMADLIFSCPPYADLEVYSEDPKDLSTMDHDSFFRVYTRIMQSTFAKLKNNRFAVVVMGEVRGKKGAYLGTIPKTIQLMEDAGFQYWNEMVLINSAGTLPLRAGRSMTASRKVGKMHQNILVFVKGSAKQASKDLGTIALSFESEDAQGGEDENFG